MGKKKLEKKRKKKIKNMEKKWEKNKDPAKKFENRGPTIRHIAWLRKKQTGGGATEGVSGYENHVVDGRKGRAARHRGVVAAKVSKWRIQPEFEPFGGTENGQVGSNLTIGSGGSKPHWFGNLRRLALAWNKGRPPTLFLTI